MDPNLSTYRQTAIAQHNLSMWLGDSTQNLGDSLRATVTGLEVVGVPSKDELVNSSSYFSSLIGRLPELATSFHYVLGDALLELEARYGTEAMDDAISERIKNVPTSRVLDIVRVCRTIPKPDRLTTFTASEEVSNHWRKLSPEERREVIEFARDGEAVTIENESGKTVEKRDRSCQEIRAFCNEKTGKVKPPNLNATLRDPTHDAERLRLAEEVCRQAAAFAVENPRYVSSGLSESLSAWEAHMATKEPA